MNDVKRSRLHEEKKNGLPIVNFRNRENVSVRISARAIVIVNVTVLVLLKWDSTLKKESH